jgi:hypothetical protein
VLPLGEEIRAVFLLRSSAGLRTRCPVWIGKVRAQDTLQPWLQSPSTEQKATGASLSCRPSASRKVHGGASLLFGRATANELCRRPLYAHETTSASTLRASPRHRPSSARLPMGIVLAAALIGNLFV